MPATRETPTWRILPAAGGHFLWASAGGDQGGPGLEAPAATLGVAGDEESRPGSRLPSVADLWLQARPRILEGGGGDGGGVPMFRTGSGRSVSVRESSLLKARSILGDGEGTNCGNANGRGTPMFCTGSGRPVSVRESSILRAKSVLEDGDGANCGNENGSSIPMFRTGSGRMVSVRESSILTAKSLLAEGATTNNRNGDEIPMFSRGSGGSLSVREGSIQKARSVLGDGGCISGRDGGDVPTRSGGSISVQGGSIQKARSVRGHGGSRNEGDGGSVPMFCTGSGRPVSVREASIRKARPVLESGDNISSGDGSGVPMICSKVRTSNSVTESSIKKARAILGNGDTTNNADGGSGPLFCTRSGRLVSGGESSIQKARSVLGDGYSVDGGNGSEIPMFSAGSGESVARRESSILKARPVLGDGDNTDRDCDGNDEGLPMFFTGSGKSVMMRKSSIEKAAAVLEGKEMEKDLLHKFAVNGNRSFSNSFQTGSGKNVNLSSAGLLRASTLLGLARNSDLSTLPCLERAKEQPSASTAATWENSHDRLKWDMNPGNAVTFNVDPVLDVQRVQGKLDGGLRDLISGDQSHTGVLRNPLGSEVRTSNLYTAKPPIKFQTAGGRYISVSSDALQRARSLLGESDLEVHANDSAKDNPLISSFKERAFDEALSNKENISFACTHQDAGMNEHALSSNHKQSFDSLQHLDSRDLIVNQVHANGFALENFNRSSSDMPHLRKPSNGGLFVTSDELHNMRIIPEYSTLGGPLVDISNNIDHANINLIASERKRIRKRGSISSFKRPRSSRFTAPLNKGTSSLAAGSFVPLTTDDFCHRKKVSARYPFQIKRKSLKDFFGGPHSQQNLLKTVADEVKHMNVANALMYKFHDVSCFEGIGSDAFQNMLLQSGASLVSASKEWVRNHYKWIVWKLACLERCYPAQASGKYLTVSNVLEELKYRYEREVNYGHRSAIKKILEGDVSPSSMMILCVSAIHSYSAPRVGKMDDAHVSSEDNNSLSSSVVAVSSHAAKIELTDGWYSLDTFLDVSLSKQLLVGKLFVGQKLRIWGASLCGWVGPVSPLEASKTVSLLVHINGTYRAHWADPLGFCKVLGAPLAFRCIKGIGGKVPRTLVGVTRIYPVLYKERFPDGRSVVRSERMESKALQLYNQRRSNIAEDIISEQQDVLDNFSDSDEGARIFKMLETAAEPEVLMADMSSEQLNSFSAYQAKQKDIRQSDMQRKIEKTLKDAGLGSREVTPFMRVRVVGLTSKGSTRRGRPREGLITIWNPTEKQKDDLVEGLIYSVTGLMPINFGADVLYLQARGSSTAWKALPSIQTEKFEPFFTPRKAVQLSTLGEIPLASEFDVAAVILHVGEVHTSGRQKKQWVFVTDGTNFRSKLEFEEPYNCLLAVSFSSSISDDDSSPLFGHTLSGTTVGFCNLVKRARDQMNHLWVAEATENSTCSTFYSLPTGSHLREAADSAQRWAKVSFLTIEKLRERILCILGRRS